MAHQRPLIIGHRGASGYRPEHTRAAYRLAIALGADAVEPDLVATRDGVLVVRHENEISSTTDVASRPEFAHLRTTKRIDGRSITGWFTEDFEWHELATLRARERLPGIRAQSATFDGMGPILRLADLLDLLDAARARDGRRVGLVAELKHPSYFASIGLRLEGLVADALAGWEGDLIVECFEQSALAAVRDSGLPARYVYLMEQHGASADLVARDGDAALPYAAQRAPERLQQLAGEVDGISLDKAVLLPQRADGSIATTDLVARAHEAGLSVFTWTLRPENAFLAKPHRRGGGRSAWGQWRREFGLLLATGVDGVFTDHPDLAVVARDG